MSVSPRTFGSLLRNEMEVKCWGWKAQIGASTWRSCSPFIKRNCSKPKEAPCSTFFSSKVCYSWFSSCRLSSALHGITLSPWKGVVLGLGSWEPHRATMSPRALSSCRGEIRWEFTGIWLSPCLAYWGSGMALGPWAGQGPGKPINSGTLLAWLLCAEM